MSEEISLTKKYFHTNHIALSDEWLESCINWFKEENLGKSYTNKELQSQVYEQWLLLDFRDVNVPVIPPNIINEKKTIINKTICLQLMQVVDISKPKLWQLQKIRNSNNQNTEQEALTGKRVLQLTLTDGVQEILATEYKTVPFISLNLSPGIKVRLIAPITIRRGQVMLEAKSINILGGEVEDLLVENAAENVLAKLLNLPINNNPIIVEETFESADKEIINQTNQSNRSNQTGNKVVGNKIQSSITDYTNKSSNIGSKKIENLFNKSINDFTAEDEMKIDEEINLILEAECNNITGNHQGTSTQIPKKPSPDIFDDDFEYQDFDQIDKIESQSSKKQINAVKPNISKKATTQNFNDDCDSDEIDEMLAIEREVNLYVNKPNQSKSFKAKESKLDKFVSKEALIENEIKIPSKRKVMTIKELLRIKQNVTKGKFTAHARFENVVKKLTITDNEFSMKIKIKDDSEQELIVAFHSDVIAALLGYTVEAIMKLKQEVVDHQDSTKGDIIFSAINGLRDKLLLLDHDMEILLESSNDPTVVHIIDL